MVCSESAIVEWCQEDNPKLFAQAKATMNHVIAILRLPLMADWPKSEANRPMVGKLLRELLHGSDRYLTGYLYFRINGDLKVISYKKWWSETHPDILWNIIENITLLPDATYLFWSEMGHSRVLEDHIRRIQRVVRKKLIKL